MTSTALVLWLFALGGQGGASSVPDGLAAAKVLYASGAYEDALSRLSSVTSDGAIDDVGQYRALCLLALGRSTEARRSLEEMIVRRPQFKMPEGDVSPQLVSLFHEVRRQVLPATLKTLYTRGKASYEQKQYADATATLKDLIGLLTDEDLGADASSYGDFRLLAEGFLRLSESELAAASKAAPPPDPAPASITTPAASAEPPVSPPAPIPAGTSENAPAIYSPADRDVTPPVEISRGMPTWRPRSLAARSQDHRGLLRILIDERGRVASASLVTSVEESYDNDLLAATKQWKYSPATKAGVPVKYEKLIAVVLTAK